MRSKPWSPRRALDGDRTAPAQVDTLQTDTRPGVSVIIPVRRINDYVRESLPHILAISYISYPSLEVLILPDATYADDGVELSDRVRVVPTGPMGPAEKRDIGAGLASGAILAFLDDDSYPQSEWLNAAIPHFQDERVAAVGGPAVTPTHDSFWQQVSGWTLSTPLGSGGALIRYLPVGAPRLVDDWPTVNLLVRKADFERVGGFNCAYYPGEDTKLCLDLTHTLGKQIIYEPGAVVYHHRRSLFWGHFRQIGRYAAHRGFFVKAFPATSRRLMYFLPSLLVLWLVLGLALSPLSLWLATVYASGVFVYLTALAITAVSIGSRTRHPGLAAATAGGLFATHVWYGVQFIRGLLMPRLAR